MADTIRLVIISDTHGFHEIVVPPGDVLIHGGDGCKTGTLDEARQWGAFLDAQPHAHKIAIAGNHDRCFEADLDAARAQLPSKLEFLHDSGCELDGVRYWGAPWQPWFLSWAFNLPRGPELGQKWALIPDNTDVLVTHGPPHGILDRTYAGEPVGCEELRAAVARVRPRVHVFGHIHEGYGVASRDGTMFVNASTCTLSYRPTNAAIVVDLPRDRARPAELVSGG
ncbi:Calcineurin-like phosphoesterase superfamily domain protein [Enhygromyxa salina]|uniref:Calcineurin-like phosphoesterase superfamily domain protein n=1 Tax=Enhygromyxa salina TaxID=215803 RepID=A0A2S9XEC1_9BACT|nr:metallophosphatase domain-containing protein [Enhygromyxa salina]PRP91216.1 Calcineurin-like phosphoesterase superfamily domain protein [Enhygromyxa salina]